MKNLKWITLALMIVLALTLAACGGGDTPEEPAAPAPAATEAPAVEEEAPAEDAPAASEEFMYDDEWGVVVVEAGDPVKLGFAAGLSGAGIDVLGIDEQRGAELAVRDLGDINGFGIELAVEDSQCSGDGGTAIANKFVADGDIVGVVGHMCSGSCIPASDIYEQSNYTMVSPSCTAVAFTARGLNAANRVAWSDAIQGPAAAEFIKNTLGLERIATIHDGSPYGEGLVGETAAAFEALGGTVVSQEAVNVGDTDMRPVLTKIKSTDPQLIYFGGFVAEGAFLASQRTDVGMGEVQFMGADGIKATDFVEAAGSAAEGSYASAADFAEAGPGLPQFLEDYLTEYGEEPPAPFHAHTYDAVMVIANAISDVAKQDADGNLHIGRKALNDAIRATSGYQGLSGLISCDDKGDCGTGTVSISAVRDGEFVDVSAPAEEGEESMAMGPKGPEACEDPGGVVIVEAGDPVTLGFAAGLSGAGIDVLGIDEQRGAELAVRDIGDVYGFDIELAVEDSQCSGDGGTAIANKFVADGDIVGVVGHMCSGSCIPASDIYEQSNYTMVSPSCTAVAFTARGLSAANRVAWSDAIQGPAAAEFIKNTLGLERIATIHDGSPYGEGLVGETAAAFEALGGTVVSQEAVNVGDTDMRPVLTKIKSADPQLIYFGGFVAEGAFLASQRTDVGMGEVQFMGADGIKATDFVEAAGSAAEGSYASAADFAEAGPGLPQFLEDYLTEYGEEPPAPFHAHTYDAVMVLVNAIKSVAGQDADGNLCIGRTALNEAVRSTAGYQGLSGMISCDDKGDCGTGTVSISIVQDGEFVEAGQ